MGGGGIVVRSCSSRRFEARASEQEEQQQDQEEEQQQQEKKKSSSGREQTWPVNALQAVEAQLGLLSASSNSTELQRRDDRSRFVGEDESDSKYVDVDLLHSHQPLPRGWERFLDLKTGEVYYIDWSSYKRTQRDPREAVRVADDRIRAWLREKHLQQLSSSSRSMPSTSSSSSSQTATFPRHRPELSSGDEEEDEEASSSSRPQDSHHNVMVALGCHRCLTYFLVPRLDPTCPNCGSQLEVKN